MSTVVALVLSVALTAAFLWLLGRAYELGGRWFRWDVDKMRRTAVRLAQADLAERVDSVRKCQRCESENTLEAHFCGNCGMPLTTPEQSLTPGRQQSGADGSRSWRAQVDQGEPIVCVCGAMTSVSARFCGACGFDLRRIPISGHDWWRG